MKTIIGIESYCIRSTATDIPKNQMSVTFAIAGKALEPRDYQELLERFKTVCKEINAKDEWKNG